ncbi:MAG TPA: DUF488 family protein [Opitutaceae bacterium]|nr:DUF488 family protein [Opitutaceae bacterium]
MIRLKRAYAAPAKEDGARILVERLWPRGVSKGRAKLDLWLREIAPSAGLRTWFGHDPAKWPEFRRRYRAELRANPGPVRLLRERAARGPLTLVFAARDEERNSAVVLKDLLGKEA